VWKRLRERKGEAASVFDINDFEPEVPETPCKIRKEKKKEKSKKKKEKKILKPLVINIVINVK
jgi:hypothetical protein